MGWGALAHLPSLELAFLQDELALLLRGPASPHSLRGFHQLPVSVGGTTVTDGVPSTPNENFISSTPRQPSAVLQPVKQRCGFLPMGICETAIPSLFTGALWPGYSAADAGTLLCDDYTEHRGAFERSEDRHGDGEYKQCGWGMWQCSGISPADQIDEFLVTYQCLFIEKITIISSVPFVGFLQYWYRKWVTWADSCFLKGRSACHLCWALKTNMGPEHSHSSIMKRSMGIRNKVKFSQ